MIRIVCGLWFWFDLGHTMAYDCSAKTHGHTPRTLGFVQHFCQEPISIDGIIGPDMEFGVPPID
jgi:hypothetical protein